MKTFIYLFIFAYATFYMMLYLYKDFLFDLAVVQLGPIFH